MKNILSAMVMALALSCGLPALADNSGGSAASTFQVGKLNKGGPSHSNLRLGQKRVTFQIGNAGVNWSNVTLKVSSGKRVHDTVSLPSLNGVKSWSWSVPQGISAGTLAVTWQGTVSQVASGAAEKGISNKGVKGCETC